MDDAKIEIYIHPNQEIRSFLMPLEIFAFQVEHFKNPLDQESWKKLKRLGPPEVRIVREIMAISGVEEVYIKPKEIRMKKTRYSSWGDIQEEVISVLQRSLRRKNRSVLK